jgi:hypothetical protein
MKHCLSTLCLVLLCSIGAACKVYPTSLGGTPIYSDCTLPALVDEDEGSAACESTSFGAPTRIYPSSKEDRRATCALRFPSVEGDPDDLCPTGELLALELNGALVVIEGQRAGENAGVFVHAFTSLGAEASFEYAGASFVPDADGSSVPLESDVKDGFSLSGPPLRAYGSGARFIDRDAVVDLEGTAFHVKGRFALTTTLYPVLMWAEVPSPGGVSRRDYVVVEDYGGVVARKITDDGETVFTWNDTISSRSSLRYDAVAVAEDGDIALVGTETAYYGNNQPFGNLVLLDGEHGTLQARFRTPAYSRRSGVRYLDEGRVFLLGVTGTSFSSSGGRTQAHSNGGSRGLLAFVIDTTTGCPSMIHEHEAPPIDDEQLSQSLLTLDSVYVFGVKPWERNADAELRLADFEGHHCDSVALEDDGAPSALTQIIQITSGDFIATDGTDIWHVPNTR